MRVTLNTDITLDIIVSNKTYNNAAAKHNVSSQMLIIILEDRMMFNEKIGCVLCVI